MVLMVSQAEVAISLPHEGTVVCVPLGGNGDPSRLAQILAGRTP